MLFTFYPKKLSVLESTLAPETTYGLSSFHLLAERKDKKRAIFSFFKSWGLHIVMSKFTNMGRRRVGTGSTLLCGRCGRGWRWQRRAYGEMGVWVDASHTVQLPQPLLCDSYSAQLGSTHAHRLGILGCRRSFEQWPRLGRVLRSCAVRHILPSQRQGMGARNAHQTWRRRQRGLGLCSIHTLNYIYVAF